MIKVTNEFTDNTGVCVNYVYFNVTDLGITMLDVLGSTLRALKNVLSFVHGGISPGPSRAAVVAVFLLLTSVSFGAFSSEIFSQEAARFLEIQRDSYNAMLTGQGRLKRACSVPMNPSPRGGQTLPDLTSMSGELSEEAERFISRASARYSAAKRDQALQCKNPLGKVLELFGAESPCTEAEATTTARGKILSSASEWAQLLDAQLQVLDDARQLEANGCLSPGFTSKLTEAYRDSVRPRGVSLRTLFDRWTSDP